MTIGLSPEIPADHRLFLELPLSVPTGVKAQVEINIPAVYINPKVMSSNEKIDNVRQLLQKEMTEKGTLAVISASGDGWEASVREHYAES